MTIAIVCQACGQTGNVPDAYGGKHVRCPKCRAKIAVPGSAPAPPSPIAALTPSNPPPPVRPPGENPEGLRVNCPYCGEFILAIAKKCKHCGEILEDELRASRQEQEQPAPVNFSQDYASTTAPAQVVVVQNESQLVPALVNLFFPPFGQLIQGRIGAFFFYVLAWVVAFVLGLLTIVGFILLPLIYIFCIVDAARYKPPRSKRYY